MLKRTIQITLASAFLLPSSAMADYCTDQFIKHANQANGKLGALFKKVSALQDKADKLSAAKIVLDSEVATISAKLSQKSTPALTQALAENVSKRKNADTQLAQIEQEKPQYFKEISSLKANAPKSLQDEAEKCAKDYGPVNVGVNILVQGLALYYGGAEVVALLTVNNPKSLYVDMGEVLNGNILGGPDSAPNQAKDFFNRTLGLKL